MCICKGAYTQTQIQKACMYPKETQNLKEGFGSRKSRKGALENGEGLGFGYAWLPPKAAEALRLRLQRATVIFNAEWKYLLFLFS